MIPNISYITVLQSSDLEAASDVIYALATIEVGGLIEMMVVVLLPHCHSLDALVDYLKVNDSIVEGKRKKDIPT